MIHTELSPDDKNQLLNVARKAIEHYLENGYPLEINMDEYSPSLSGQRATFVTLHIENELCGCIGTLEAYQALVADIAHNAHAAAFSDPRFPALEKAELAKLDIHISILNPAEAMQFDSEEKLVAQLRPGVDGLILTEGRLKGTFLPSVWEALPDPHQFLAALKQKAGLHPDYWSDTIQVERYTTASFS